MSEKDKLSADLKVGQEFKGQSYRYEPAQFTRLDLAVNDDLRIIEGRAGDLPAIALTSLRAGLNTILYESATQVTSYASMEKFASFVGHKDLGDAVARHRARALDEKGFREAYSRHAKSLIAVGSGQGADRAYGLLTEFVATENPYADDTEDGLDVQLLFEGKPRSDAQIEVFEKNPATEEIAISLIRTDAQGLASISVKPGHIYMLDAVVLREPSDALADERKVVWESLWANLTFQIPAN